MTETNKLNDLAKNIKIWGETLGFQQVAISQPNLDQASKRLLDWLEKGYQGSMQWMAEHGDKRYRAEKLVQNTVRVISVRMDYLNDSKADLVNQIATEGAVTDAVEAGLKAAFDEFKAQN